ncbi:MAG: hypothetical protein LBF28_01480, partial [Rickettsiales bacterium]|nr:hypothetical protein [Rickettsiales bacterium]
MFDIIYCFDGKFWMQAAASINSLLKSKSPDTVYSIHCAVPRGTAGRRKIESLVRRTNCRLIWKELKNKENPFRNFDHRLWSPVIFYRLFAHRIFPNLQTVLYLDCDTMINHDLTELFNTEFQGFAVAAVEDLADEKNPINLFGK